MRCRPWRQIISQTKPYFIHNMKAVLTSVLCSLAFCLIAQPTTFENNGAADKRADVYAFTNATIYLSPDKKMDQATLIIREGRVESVGKNGDIPKGAIVTDLKGKYIYPAFIDLFSNYGINSKGNKNEGGDGRPQMETKTEGAYAWNQTLKPEYVAARDFVNNPDAAKALRESGFGAVLTHRFDGMARGAGALVLLGEEKENLMLLNAIASNNLSFKKGSSTQDYPSSLMGGIALLRQTYLDAEWYKKVGFKEQTNLSLQAWNDLSKLPTIFEVKDRQEALRADKLGDEFEQNYIIKGNGDEYQRLDELKKTGATFIIPLHYPKAFDVEDPYDASVVGLSDMKHWELAPANAARIAAAKIRFVLSTTDLSKEENFLANLRKAVKYGLSKEDALRALTLTPAELINAENEIGTLGSGKRANFFISDKDIFEKDATIYSTWINGKPYQSKALDAQDLRGTYILSINGISYPLVVKGESADAIKMSTSAAKDSTNLDVKFSVTEKGVSLVYPLEKKDAGKVLRLTGIADAGNWAGIGKDAEGNSINWSATKTQEFVAEEKKEDKAEATVELGEVTYPFMAFGNTELPKEEDFLIKNVTVWTNEAEGIIDSTDVLIKNGRISKIGRNLSEGGAVVVDGTGKHLTAGIIDEHSHIAISRGVNEGTQASSAEVRIGDVINAEDINIYRDLAGGVTAAQLLHGSANPIGGQSAIIKLRWGYTPERMKFEGAPGFIKFALGENVKQSNWGDNSTVRFPQTRMGVEQVYEDFFSRAKEYMNNRDKNKRRDLELETLAEIIRKERFITCHSYQQGEINMLMKVANRYGFKINTFTHILEGYKVADKMATHGVGGSTFADWWAYKMEVKDAIPYNAYILNKMNIVTAINSDDAEMSRRLNQEAAKAVKYGGMTEEEAWKLVTLNPAKLLHIDNTVGSVKVGKSADLVLWSTKPLSIYAQAEKTWVDGILFYDKNKDSVERVKVAAERTRLIKKLLNEKANGGATQKPVMKNQHLWDCEDVSDEMED